MGFFCVEKEMLMVRYMNVELRGVCIYRERCGLARAMPAKVAEVEGW